MTPKQTNKLYRAIFVAVLAAGVLTLVLMA